MSASSARRSGQHSPRARRCGTGCCTATRSQACWSQTSLRISERDCARFSMACCASARGRTAEPSWRTRSTSASGRKELRSRDRSTASLAWLPGQPSHLPGSQLHETRSAAPRRVPSSWTQARIHQRMLTWAPCDVRTGTADSGPTWIEGVGSRAGPRKPTGPDREGHERDGHDHVPGDADFPHLHGPPPPPEPGDPGPGIRELLEGKSGLYLPERPAKVTVERARNPAPRGSFGYVDRFVTVRGSRGELPRGKLVVAVDHKGLGTVHPETLRVFRWDQKEKAFQAIFRSAPGQTRDYGWADRSAPGV